MKILLADDSVTAQNMGKKILAEAGHEVVCVSNGAAALKKVAEQEPDLVILDIYMPGYSGLEVCQRLKEGRATAELPVVLTVGKLEPFRKEDAQRVRAEALIVKPFEASELAAAVARFAEVIAASPSKPGKSRGKLGPAAKAKPRWEETPEDDFVTTSQKEMQKEDAAEELSSPAPDEEEFAPREFEATPDQGAEESPAGPESRVDAGMSSAESEAPAESPVAEFSVNAEEMPAAAAEPAGELPVAAKAAAAGAAFGAGGDVSIPEFAMGGSPSASFGSEIEVSGRQEAAGTEPAELPSGPEMSAAPAPPAATEEFVVAPGPDPAFEPDRTQWASQFATQIGLPEEKKTDQEPTSPDEHKAEAPSEQHQVSADTEPSTAADEIAAILSSLPGGFSVPVEERQGAEGSQFGQRPWPTEASGAAGEWKAEEVPVEDRESSVSLSEEMEKATRVAETESAQPNVARQEVEAGAEPASPASIPGSQERDSWPETAAPESAPHSAGGAFAAEPAQLAPESRQSSSDRVAGVMQSAAMAIATRAAVSAVTSQLHSQPGAENETAASSGSIEDLVNTVLQRLKPRLIAEIKRELGTPEDK